MRARRSLQSTFMVGVMSILVAALLGLPTSVSAQDDLTQNQRGAQSQTLPDIRIDALAGNEWSLVEVSAAPGQKLIVTNRDVERHTFVVAEWSVQVSLPTLTPVELFVPEDAVPGDSVTFYSDVGNQREAGLEGTIAILTGEEVLAGVAQRDTVSAAVENRTVVELRDDFTMVPAEIVTYPGSIIEVRNIGVMEHHFAVDGWMINETVSPGESTLVQVPADVAPGDSFEALCTVPGHSASGMKSTIMIDVPPGGAGISTLPETGNGTRTTLTDLRPFLPEDLVLGQDWSQLRSGSASSVITGRAEFNVKVFPGEGIGAAYVGPAGSRVTIVVMPLQTHAVPANQVEDAIDSVQASLTQGWSTDQLSSASLQRIDPPVGCDLANRSSGIVPVLTLPAGSTACQIRSAGIAIFVMVEGEIDGLTGVAAADALLDRMLSGETRD